MVKTVPEPTFSLLKLALLHSIKTLIRNYKAYFSKRPLIHHSQKMVGVDPSFSYLIHKV